ncbi:hypothetical protein ULMS_17650 [Patiriisocius marinistellae]|uniref:Uncharacterized protein n=1 Tax=Patiriisocius marinistellae TaxID=2494560 RepID=A0A5J4FUG6_9FLAO|nr:hypothetical protein [Patiriisocius marinistellae]GEQ86257.1 hypothetical protein ULMS_17650 [Patiriisocius marinistellae]
MREFTSEKGATLKKYKHANIEIENGWYSVTILGGITRQVSENKAVNEEVGKLETMEPTFEFIIRKTIEKPEYTANFSYQFKIET